MSATFIGVRHHSPACARLVRRTIDELRPAYVLIEGPADLNDRMDELLLGHELPIAILSYVRDPDRTHLSWTPFCDYSPEWVALTAGRARGADVRFIDLPAWHPAFAGRSNRYADAEARYAEVMDRLCRTFAVDNVDALWDHLFEIEPDDGIEERLSVYFELVRGGRAADDADIERERYMAGWVSAALAGAGTAPVVVVTGGFHRPAIMSLTEPGADGPLWPDVPLLPSGTVGGSYLVPYSFKRLDAFTGYQSGMPSPGYYQRLWVGGPERAADGLVEAVVDRLRRRRQPVSTVDLIAARSLTVGLARMRGHRHPARTDVLDGLLAALVTTELDAPPPWTSAGTIAAGTDPVVVEMLAALSGAESGRLHRDTPAPPLVVHVTAELERHGLDGNGPIRLDLTRDGDLARSRLLHRLRILAIPGFDRVSGPAAGTDPVLDETWRLSTSDLGLPALIEAGAYGPTLADAAAAVLVERIAGAGTDLDQLAALLFDTALAGVHMLSGEIVRIIAAGVARVGELDAFGAVLSAALGLWRHDRLLGSAGSPMLGAVITAAVARVLWLAEGVHGGPAPADPHRLAALAATRDALVHAGTALGIDRPAALAVARRIAVDRTAPPDLRGAALGLSWSFGEPVDPVSAVRGAAVADTLGDWLAGLFALARDEVLATGSGDDGVLGVLDEVVAGLPEHTFLVALPALRQAFRYFPPRERELVAERLLERRGLAGSGRGLLRVSGDPVELAELARLEARVDELLAREGLGEVR
jgi:hypothetical protein